MFFRHSSICITEFLNNIMEMENDIYIVLDGYLRVEEVYLCESVDFVPDIPVLYIHILKSVCAVCILHILCVIVGSYILELTIHS